MTSDVQILTLTLQFSGAPSQARRTLGVLLKQFPDVQFTELGTAEYQARGDAEAVGRLQRTMGTTAEVSLWSGSRSS